MATASPWTARATLTSPAIPCSTNFPTMNPLQPANGGGYDAFVAELNPTGSALVYSTYLGGSGDDVGYGIAVDSSGNAYVTGIYRLNQLSHYANAFAASQWWRYADAFVTKLNPTGSALVYSTYLGGSGNDVWLRHRRGQLGQRLRHRKYHLNQLSHHESLAASCNGGGVHIGDAFVTKFNPTGSALVYSTYLGGSGDDQGYGIAVDSSGNAYVTGLTSSTDFPTMNPLQPANGGG